MSLIPFAVLITLINCLSVKASIYLQNILTIAKLAAIVIIIIGGFVKLGQGTVYIVSPFNPFVSYDKSSYLFMILFLHTCVLI